MSPAPGPPPDISPPPASIGPAIATRAIMAELRAGMDGAGARNLGGPVPFSKADRSRFLQALDRVMVGMG